MVIYHFFWYSSSPNLSTIFSIPLWHDDMESWNKKLLLVLEPIKLEYCMRGTRVHQTRVPICIGMLPRLKLFEHNTSTQLTLSTFWTPVTHIPTAYSLITHFLNLPLTLSILLSTHSDFLNLAIKLSHTLSISLSVSLSLSFFVSLSLSVSLLLCCSISLSLCCSVSLSLCCSCSRSPSHKVCLAQLASSIWALGICGYLWWSRMTIVF